MSAKLWEWNGTRPSGPVAIHLPPRNFRTPTRKFWLNGSRPIFKTDLRGITLGQGLYRSGSLSYLDNLLSRFTSCESCKRFCFSCSLIAFASPFQHSRMGALRKFFGHEVHRPTLPLPQVRTFPYPMVSGNSIWEKQKVSMLVAYSPSRLPCQKRS